MSNNNSMGGATAAKDLSKADLLALVNQLQAEKAQQEKMNGIQIECVEGVSKAGKAFKVLQVKGGDLGWRGLNLKPAMWRRLMDLQTEIEAALAQHFPGE